jgi:Ser/Thr protein kinase RdoA (MazF antagonist)
VTGAQVLRVGENAVVLLPQAGALARVVPGEQMLGHVQHEVEVSRWLASVGVPVVRPVVEEPEVAAGCVVVFWEYLVGARSVDLVTLARCLRQLHAVAAPVDPILSAVEPFGRFDERLQTAAVLSAGDKRFLVEYRDELRRLWTAVSFDLPNAVVHGDAHMENLLRAADGRLAFVDLESVAIGPPEWDLTLTALYLECGWFTPEQYDAFVEAYGFDVRASPAWPALRGARMLRMVTWLAQSAGDYPERAAQLRHRLASLRDGTAPAGWTGY